ncbi:hypothetical protein OUZ56_004598 [Daphnia magna]|uniref:Uncharacterized protein n=1 Tax=Daphnia magna TaxID=35525 RepID=A0ABQ9YQA5_9CRUS|nr:hypothetical protein OUZ56_004598 [Daphnia magna]
MYRIGSQVTSGTFLAYQTCSTLQQVLVATRSEQQQSSISTGYPESVPLGGLLPILLAPTPPIEKKCASQTTE